MNMLEIEITRTTQHVTPRRHSRRRYRCQSTFIFVFKNTQHVTFGFGVEQRMKFCQHIHTRKREGGIEAGG